jgi:tetratricopeptide (TPR) repeat protein
MAQFLRDMRDDRAVSASLRGRTLGRYVVLGELGSGAMGTVLKAYDESLDRTVAIKLLHSEAAACHPEWLEREALALGRLSHPNVVHVYELAQADDQWFIAMELVGGQTLRQWQHEGRGWQASLRAYLQAGEGLAAAHAAGLVHRDFKPDNCIIDERGHVRVLDFGLAGGAVVPSADEATEVTVAARDHSRDDPSTTSGAIVGTPAYMPPEQMRGEEADARSDQFSFCVSLYEAIHGERPYAGRTLTALMRSILAGDVGESSRRTRAPKRLREILRRGLAAEPERRWPTMEALLEELRRLVAPRTQRWLALGVAGGMVAVGLGLARYAEVGFRCDGAEAQLEGIWDEAHKQEVRTAILDTGLSYAPDTWERVVEPAMDRYADAWVSQHEEACEATSVRNEQSAEALDLRMMCLHRARTALDAAAGVLANPDADVVMNAHEITEGLRSLAQCEDIEALATGTEPPPPAEETKVADIRLRLEQAKAEREAGRYMIAQQRIQEAKQNAEEVEYEALNMEIGLECGRVLSRLGQYQAAEDSLRQAAKSAARYHDWDIMRQALASLALVVGEKQLRMQEGLLYGELAAELAKDEPSAEAATLALIASIYHRQGRYEEAEGKHRQALLLRTQTFGPEHLHVASSLNNLANVLSDQGKYEEAETEGRRAVAIREMALGPRHPDVAQSLSNLANIFARQRDYKRAEQEYRRALIIKEAALGSEHPEVARSRTGLAIVLGNQGRYGEAEVEHRRALASLEHTLGPDHPHVATSRDALAVALSAQGRYTEAETEHRRALALKEKALGPEHPEVAKLRSNLATVLFRQGRHAEAEAEHRRVLMLRVRALGPEHPETAYLRNNLANALSEQGKHEEAEEEYRTVETILNKTPNHPILALARSNLGIMLLAQGKHDEAEIEHRRALAQYENILEPDHQNIALFRYNLANVLFERGNAEEACHLAELAWSRHRQDDVPREDQASTAFLLSRALWATGKKNRARTLAKWALDLYQGIGATYATESEDVRKWMNQHHNEL